jgi:hypothetical protein
MTAKNGDGTGSADASGAVSADVTPLSAEERKARLNRAVANLSREFRASVRSQSDFEALLVRGKPVYHRVRLRNLGLVAILGLALGLGLGGGAIGILKGAVLPAAYGVYWLFLALTGGEELDRIHVDDAGVVHSNRTGRSPETRGDFTRVAIPIVAIAVSGWITVGLIHDIVVQPQPVCNVIVKIRPDDCVSLPNISALMNASADLGSPSASPAASSQTVPVASPDASAAAAAAASSTSIPVFTVNDWMFIERIVRGLQLVVSLLLLLSSAWFLRRMLTGRWVVTIRPVHHRLSDE